MSDYRQLPLGANLWLRSQILRAIRNFFHRREYLEVETPCRIPAPAPELYIDAEPAGAWYLQTSPELCMKRLLAAGFPRIYQICRCFRRQERGARHLPEFTLLEWYTAGAGYREMMTESEDLIRFVVRASTGKGSLTYNQRRIALQKPWDRLTVAEAFRCYGSIPLEKALASGRFDEVMGCEIEPRLGTARPVFVYDYPAELGALARLKPQDATLAERFELYIAGLEICNAFTELTDPVEQRLRFEGVNRLRTAQGEDAYPLPERFLHALSDMPFAAGNALGVDRLVMLLAGAQAIDDVVAFVPETL